MRKIRTLWAASAMLGLGWTGAAACDCRGSGQSAEYEAAGAEHKDGNQDVFWTSGRFRARARPNEQGWIGRFCYRQTIENLRPDLLAYPEWDVAGLRRAQSIPPRYRLCLSLLDPQPQDSIPQNGEIRYGSRRDNALPTPDVYAPALGFRASGSRGPGLVQPLRPPPAPTVPGQPDRLQRPIPPAIASPVEARLNDPSVSIAQLQPILGPLISQIVLEGRGVPMPVYAIRIASTVDPEGRLSLVVTNQGVTNALVAINLSLTDRQASEFAILPQRRDTDFRRSQDVVAFNAQAGRPVTLVLPRDPADGLTAEFAAVQVRSPDGDVLIIAAVPVYVAWRAAPMIDPVAFGNAIR